MRPKRAAAAQRKRRASELQMEAPSLRGAMGCLVEHVAFAARSNEDQRHALGINERVEAAVLLACASV